jgi:2-succinyl-5-enolpyruvyl-6-hydroxy-3-cyclohexene-1-carboxylate synthase
MGQLYTNEINVQIVIALLKAHGISKVVASPGATNITFVGSIQNDPFFTIYSAVDERSAAYIACGLSEESGEPVVLSCTGATASRNYAPGLTEAFYRKLPILAITSTQLLSRIGHHVAQVIDRSNVPNDTVKISVTLPFVNNAEEKEVVWDCEIKTNKAILELKRHGGGPVHINLPTMYTLPFETKTLPNYRIIDRITVNDSFPNLDGRVAVFIGSHKAWTESQTIALDNFCSINNGVVFCDHTSGYKGKYRLLFSLVAAQKMMDKSNYKPDILIHIGEISGDYSSLEIGGKTVWRISEDGEIRDTFRTLRYVFEMKEEVFFNKYSVGEKQDNSYFDMCQESLNQVRQNIPELPFSNIWVASKLASKLPDFSILHLGILNSLRSWNFFEIPNSVSSASTVGGFGIDGGLSSLVGASFHKPNSLYFCVLGDLAFFYDMNILGNRHIGNNLRILLINNGKGTEFRQYDSKAAYFEDAADKYIAAANHFGNKSPTLVKQYAENLGFHYICASNKNEFNSVYQQFLSPDLLDRPIFFEVFTNSDEESEALQVLHSIIEDKKMKMKDKTKKLLGEKGIRAIKKIIRK